MFYRLFLALLLFFAAGALHAQNQVKLPDTPAGHTFTAFLDAFNSVDRAKIEAYCRTYGDPSTPDAMTSPDSLMGFSSLSGGFNVLQILESDPLHLEAVTIGRKSNHTAFVTLDVEPGDPAKVADMEAGLIPPGVPVSALSVPLDSAIRKSVIESVLAKLDEFYLSPEVAAQMKESIHAREQKGDFDSAMHGSALATALTTDLRQVSHDKHLMVTFSPVPLPERRADAAPTPEDIAAYRKQMERSNCGFEELRVLPGNIGYLKFRVFPDPDICGPTAIAAMNFLANVDAMIFDLRGNGGGDPKMISLLCTYLFAQPTHLTDVWERKSGETKQYWTLPYVPGKHLDSQPVYVLTSKQTFSGAEEFSYDLQNLKRATIVGEPTGGGAHLVRGERIDDHFMVGVPFGQAVNPVSKTNWEGTGVLPDVKAPADDALAVAEKLAAEKLASHP